MIPKRLSYNPSTSRSERAIQAWVILVSCAMNRQTITYGKLGRKMFKGKGAGVLAQPLGTIAFYCKKEKLPDLNALVVGAGRGRPGKSIPLAKSKIDITREKIYKENWFQIRIPSKEDFDEV
jgi:hypothetical protein